MPQTRIHQLKAVSFNVTREEYERLQAECASGGAHNLTELVREKIMRAVNGNSLAEVARELDELERAVQELGSALSNRRVETSGASHGR
jgi:hypothetical protein